MLRYSEEKILEPEAIGDIFMKAQEELNIRKKLYERYRRKVYDYELASETDEEIKVPLERYISIMSAGYFGGKAPIYKVKAYNKERNEIIEDLFDTPTNDEKAIKEIEEIIKHIVEYNDDASLFLNEVLDFLVKRACYEMYYKDAKTGEITIAKSDALETVAIWDYSLPKNLIGLYRIIETTMANGEYQYMVELTTVKGKNYYYSTSEKVKLFGTPNYDEKYKDETLFIENADKKQPAKWDDIPATAIEQEDGLAIFEPVISLICGYERVIQNSRNVFKYNDEAILKVVGYEPENELIIKDEKTGIDIINPARVKEDEYVLTSRVRYLDGSDGVNADIDWVEKNVNDGALQNHKKTLMDIICLCSFCPNMTDLGFTNADNNSAIEKKFFGLQQYIATFEGEFKKGLLRRWEIILNKFNKEKGKKYDFRDVEVKLQRNVPTDTASLTQTVLSLKGLLADSSLLDLLPFDLDAENELEKIATQNEENMKKNVKILKAIGNKKDNNDEFKVDDDEEEESENNNIGNSAEKVLVNTKAE